MIEFEHPWLLWLLPLAALPLLTAPRHLLRNTWAALTPRDRVSDALDGALRILGTLALAALAIAMAGPYWPEYQIERSGKGAEIVLLLDRSRSMDQGFGGAPARIRGTGPEAIDFYMRQSHWREPKGKVARKLLSEFVAGRPQDLFGMVVFSTLPIPVLQFTQKTEVVQAAIAAGDIGRGLSETNIGLALEAALSFFADRPYSGSRIVMLVSDGGDRLDPATRDRIAYLARKWRVSIYWIYLRSVNSPGLTLERGESAESIDAVPEYALHRFFQSLGPAYHAYEASNPDALKQAIDAVNRLENLPITYLDTVPRRELVTPLLVLAFACVVLLLAANRLEMRP